MDSFQVERGDSKTIMQETWQASLIALLQAPRGEMRSFACFTLAA